MIVLNDTTESIVAVLAGSVASLQPVSHAAYADTPAATKVAAKTTVLNGVTQVTIVAAPAATFQRAVKSLSIYNKDTAAVQVIISKLVSGTAYPLANATLLPGQTFSLTDSGWKMGDTGRAVDTLVVPVAIQAAISDELTAITAGASKISFRLPYGFTLTDVRASLTTASSAGIPSFDVKMNGASVLSTLVTIDATEKTSTTAAVPPVVSNPVMADDALITVDIVTAGTGATGAKIALIGTKP